MIFILVLHAGSLCWDTIDTLAAWRVLADTTVGLFQMIHFGTDDRNSLVI